MNSCYICNSERIELYREVNRFHVYRCRQCKLLWVAKINIGDLRKFYNCSYFKKDQAKTGYSDYQRDEKAIRKNAENIINITRKYRNLNGAKVLDIGCAYGFFLDEVKKKCNCEVYGIEISKHAYQYAKEKLKLNVRNCRFRENKYEPNYFDVVFIIGTIEHLVDPNTILKDIKKVLKPGGILIITTMDTNGWIPLHMIKPPEHLFYFNHDNLFMLLNKLKLRRLLCKMYFSHYFLSDLFFRLAKFTSLSVLDYIGQKIFECFPDLIVKTPTNEMMIIAENNE